MVDREKTGEIKRKSSEIEEKTAKISIPPQGIGLKLNFKKSFGKITCLLHKMLDKDINSYEEKEIKQKGNFKVERGLRIRFLDDKENQKEINWIKKKKDEQR